METFFPFPFKNRESFIYGLGVNRTKINGSVLCLAKSLCKIEDEQLKERFKTLNKPKANGLVECVILYYGFEITYMS